MFQCAGEGVGGGGGRRRRVGGTGGSERRWKRHAKEEKMGTDQRMSLVADYPTFHIIASQTYKRCQK